MNTLFEKLTALIAINVHSLIGQTGRSNDAAAFFKHYMSVEQSLIDVESTLARLGNEMGEVVKRGRQSEALVERLDSIVDEFLVNGDESSARRAQREWNNARRINLEYRTKIKELGLQRDRLLRAKDKLEVQLALMQEEKERLQELYRQYQEEQAHNTSPGPSHGTEEKIYWVIEPA